ncbi:uncharacterized protein LOC131931951 [Physella acuta]|uniref:uncharacterized protein LOC131931951 n=1 Tax=Physella acuta TaxID=109671 RepID=UPI0027DE592D|nr:uncharacterized protein LOC131931951 [Physella acuta]
MACAEGFICDSQCFGKFREYAANKQHQIHFMDLNLSSLDMYVNIYIYAFIQSDLFITCCLTQSYSSSYGAMRARPGDDFKVSSFSRLCDAMCHSRRFIEFSSTEENIMDDGEYYAVYALVPWTVDGKLEVKFIWNVTNIKGPVIGRGENNERYLSNGAGERHMYILLFSYPAEFKGDITIRENDKLVFPDDFKLRGISWYLFDHKHFVINERVCSDTTRTCAPSEPTGSGGFWRVNIAFNGTTFENPAESSPDPVVYCLEKTPPPPTTTTPPPPTTSEKKSPPNKSVMASTNVAVFACIILLFILI